MLIRLLLTDIVLIPTESGLDNQSIVKIETELHVSSVFLHLSILGVIGQYFMIGVIGQNVLMKTALQLDK